MSLWLPAMVLWLWVQDVSVDSYFSQVREREAERPSGDVREGGREGGRERAGHGLGMHAVHHAMLAVQACRC